MLRIPFVAVLTLVTAALLVSLMTSLSRRKEPRLPSSGLWVCREASCCGCLALEYSVVAIAGTAAGAALGVTVGRQMLSFLNVTETGARAGICPSNAMGRCGGCGRRSLRRLRDCPCRGRPHHGVDR